MREGKPSATAQATACVRAYLSSETTLLDDPYSRRLLTGPWRVVRLLLSRRVLSLPLLGDIAGQVAARTCFIDEQLVGWMQPDVPLLDPDDPALRRPRRVEVADPRFGVILVGLPQVEATVESVEQRVPSETLKATAPPVAFVLDDTLPGLRTTRFEPQRVGQIRCEIRQQELSALLDVASQRGAQRCVWPKRLVRRIDGEVHPQCIERLYQTGRPDGDRLEIKGILPEPGERGCTFFRGPLRRNQVADLEDVSQ